MVTVDEYEATYRALAVCVECRVPVVLWGPPGQGKTSVVRSIAARLNRPLEVLLASIREPQDFAGLPSIHEGRVTLVAPDWAARLAAAKDGILFTDEVNTAPPSVQAALLRVCLDRIAGDCDLGKDTSVIAAANPPEQAADGWDLAPPLANRFCHLEWELPTDVVRDGLVGQWPHYPITVPPADLVAEADLRERIVLAAFLSSRPDLTTVLPKSVSEQGRAFPTPRSWEMAATLSAFAGAARESDGVRRMLVRGCVGPGASAEYLTYRENLDLPNPEDVLKNPAGFKLPGRPDQLYAVGASVLAALRMKSEPDRWQAAGTVLERFAKAGHPDIAVTLARDWLRIRPESELPHTAVLAALASGFHAGG